VLYMIVGTALGVSIGRFSRWYVMVLTRKKDEDGNIVYVLTAQRDDGHKFVVLRVKDRLDVRDVVEMMDSVVEMIKKSDRSIMFQLMGKTGMLNILYEKRDVWL
jgi:phage terminase large subunit-like protein